MQLKDAMTRDVEVIRPDATLMEAAQKMKRLNVGPLPVCDGEQLVGIITDRDITVRATAAGQSPGETRVRDVMTRDVVFGFEDQDLGDAARLMEQRQIRRLVVLNQDKKLVGIVSLGDLAVDANQQLAGEVLERVSEPAEPER
jgi:CBS domain-containing protein